MATLADSRTTVPQGSGSGRLWRVAGGLAIAHVVLMFGSFALQRVAKIGADSATVTADHVRWSMTSGFAGGYLTALSFLAFLLAATAFARLLRGATDVSGWLAATVTAAATVYVAVTFGGALSDLGAALYGGHHGAPLETVSALVDAHWFAVFLATAALGVFTGCVAAAVRVTAVLPGWVAFTGFVAGAACLVSVPAAGAGLVDTATLVWVAWFVALGVAAWRRGGRGSASVRAAVVPVSG